MKKEVEIIPVHCPHPQEALKGCPHRKIIEDETFGYSHQYIYCYNTEGAKVKGGKIQAKPCLTRPRTYPESLTLNLQVLTKAVLREHMISRYGIRNYTEFIECVLMYFIGHKIPRKDFAGYIKERRRLLYEKSR